jgi:hypothetical protein
MIHACLYYLTSLETTALLKDVIANTNARISANGRSNCAALLQSASAMPARPVAAT